MQERSRSMKIRHVVNNMNKIVQEVQVRRTGTKRQGMKKDGERHILNCKKEEQRTKCKQRKTIKTIMMSRNEDPALWDEKAGP